MSEYDSQRPQDAGNAGETQQQPRVQVESTPAGSNIPYVQAYDTQTGKPLGGAQVVNKHTVVKTKTKKLPIFITALAGCACGALLVIALIMSGTLDIGGGRNAVTAGASGSSTQKITIDSEDTTLAEAVSAKALPSVVSITATSSGSQNGSLSQSADESDSSGSVGSGVVLDTEGHILTNNHVVDGYDQYVVTMDDGTTYEAEFVGNDASSDLAVIKLKDADASKLTPIEIGDSSKLNVGEWVMAIGSPFDLQSTITAGIVSAKARQLDVIPDQFRIESFIQTDAAVNPGNSGGALVNTRGELVGINTLIKSQTGSYIGYSFAIPESIVKKVVVDLKEYGVVQRALLGISYRYIDQDFIDQMGKETGIKELGGVYVATVSEDGAASAAGIRKGDVIVAIDGVKIDNASAVQEQIAKHRPNDKVKITVKRDGAVKLFDVTLRNKAGKTELITREAVDVTAALGGKFRDAGTKLCQELEIKGGVQVVGIKSNGILARARVKEGFVITHINDRPIYSLSDMERMSDKITSIDGIYPNGRAASYMLVE